MARSPQEGTAMCRQSGMAHLLNMTCIQIQEFFCWFLWQDLWKKWKLCHGTVGRKESVFSERFQCVKEIWANNLHEIMQRCGWWWDNSMRRERELALYPCHSCPEQGNQPFYLQLMYVVGGEIWKKKSQWLQEKIGIGWRLKMISSQGRELDLYPCHSNQ